MKQKTYELFLDVIKNTPIEQKPKELTKDFIEGYLDAMKDISKIIEQNKDDMTRLYDYDGIAKDVIELIKNEKSN